MRFESLISRRHRVLLAAIVASVAAAAPACLPDFEFTSQGADGGPDSAVDATSPDAGDAAPRSDASDGAIADGSIADGSIADGSIADAMPDADAAPDADPNAIGPFAENQDDVYRETAICAVRGDSLYCWGGTDSDYWAVFGIAADAGASFPLPTLIPSTPAPPSHMTQIAMGRDHTCAVYDGKVYCHGDNGNYTLGDTSAPNGPNDVTVLGVPQGSVQLLAAAEAATCATVAATDAGAQSNVYCWGTNGEGELGRPVDSPALNAAPIVGTGGAVFSDVTAIAGGGYHFCAISASQGILCWGSNDYFESGPTQPPADTGTCPGGNASSCNYQPVAVPLPSTDAGTPEIPVGIAAGVQHSCAVMQSGNVYCWGSNSDTQLGVGDAGVATTCSNIAPIIQCAGIPQRVIGLPPIKLVRAGGYSTCALDTTNQAWCWGYNNDAELGIGTTTPSEATPTKIVNQATLGAMPFRDLTVGNEGGCGTSLDGDSLLCWGQGVLGTMTPDASDTEPVRSPTLVLF